MHGKTLTLGDFTILAEASSQGGRGARLYSVSSSTVVINAGEPVTTVLGTNVVTPAANATGVVGTDYFVGIAATSINSTLDNSGGASGTLVNVIPVNTGITYLVAATTPSIYGLNGTTFVQATYDSQVGKRVTLALTNGVYTVNSTDNSANGFVVQEQNVLNSQGKVAIAMRGGLSNLA